MIGRGWRLLDFAGGGRLAHASLGTGPVMDWHPIYGVNFNNFKTYGADFYFLFIQYIFL